MTKKELKRYFLDDDTIKTDIMLVANTYQNISFDRLFKMLKGLRSRLNFKIYGKDWKKLKQPKISLHCLFEKSNNNGKVNTHANVYVQKPIVNGDVIKLCFELRTIWEQIDEKNKLFMCEAESPYGWATYITKMYEDTDDILERDLTRGNVQQKQNNYILVN